LRAVDTTISELHLDTADANCRFEQFLNLGRCGKVSFAETDRPFLLSVTKELHNYDLYSTILNTMTDSPALSASILSLSSGGDDASPDKFSEIEFVASHFDEMTTDLFAELPFAAALSILSSSTLMLNTEDSLYELLSSRFEGDFRFYELLDFVHFEHLTTSAVSAFVNRRSDVFEHLNAGIWDQICRRLSLQVHPGARNPRARFAPPEAFPMTEGRDLRGIICGLTSRFGGNVRDSGIVTVTASSAQGVSVSVSVSAVVDLARENSFSTAREASPWIMLDFGDRVVKPSGYTLIVPTDRGHSIQFGAVELLISMDGREWTRIDRRQWLFGPLDEPGLCRQALADSPEGRFLRICRARDADRPHKEAILTVIAWEVFGTIRMRSADDPVALSPGDPMLARAVAFSADRSGFAGPTRPDVFTVRPAPAVFGPAQPAVDLGLPPARFRQGICANGEALPPGLNGVMTFLCERDHRAVYVVGTGYPGGPHTPPVMFGFQELKVRGFQTRALASLMIARHRVCVTHYAVSASASHRPLGWQLECQMEKDIWMVVDVRRDAPATREIRTIALAEPIECHALRIRWISAGPGGPPILHGFDVFGTILD
jgi:hypothetical protein